MPFIKEFAEEFHSFVLESKSGEGHILRVTNPDLFIAEMLQFSKKNSVINTEEDQDLLILKYLLDHPVNITKYDILNEFHISESTWYKSYNSLKKIIRPYNLKLTLDRNKNYRITGHEKDIRSLIVKHELSDHHPNLAPSQDRLGNVYNFTADTFFHFQYKVTETVLQNISAHILLMIERVHRGHVVDLIETEDLHDRVEFQIARIICDKFITHPSISEEDKYNETILLTLTILGKASYSIDEKVQKDINTFIDNSFKKIHAKFNINFEPVEKLRLFLVLHMVPLVYRLNSGTQLRNLTTSDIHRQFPQAYDISLFFSILFKEHFDLEISSDELSYITLYFNFGIEELQLAKSSKRLLIITKLRPSETVLLRHKLLSWFPNQIIDITFITPSQNDIDFEEYDAVFATDLYESNYANAVTLINVFPDDQDFKRINLALNGYNSVESIIEKFSPECFFVGKAKSKKEIIHIVCQNAQRKFPLSEDFAEKILAREEISSTYFGNLVGMPHPLVPESSETFVSVAILDKPIQWDDQHQVQLVMLISVEKNNPRAFQFWHYMSDVVRDSGFIKQLLTKTSFEDFIDLISNQFSVN